MRPTPPTSALANSVVFRDVPESDLAELARVARRRRYRRGDAIIVEGNPGDVLHVLESGRVKVIATGRNGDSAVLGVLGPGECFGELALLDGEPRSARVEAMEAVETVSVTRNEFWQFVREHPRVTEPLLCTLAGIIRRLTETIEDLTSLDLEGRLAKKLLQLAEEHGRDTESGTEIALPLTQEELAGMVGAQRATVNKVLGQLEDRHAISRRGRHIIIRDPDRLHSRIL